MIIRLSVATALAGTLIATCFVSGSAQAASMPVLKSDAPPGLVTLVGRGGGGGHGHGGGGHGHGGGGHGHGGKYAHGGGGHGHGGKHAHHGGGGKRYYGGGGRHYAHKGGGHGHYDRHKHHEHYRSYGYYGWYGRPYFGYGYYGGGCGWLYRRAVATGSPYWWDRYYDCIGY
jgi:hypothetical protein